MTETAEQRIERVARAMCQECDPDDTSGGPHPHGGWIEEGEAWWRGYVKAARAADAVSFQAGWDAAVEALREQTEQSGTHSLMFSPAVDYLIARRPGETP